ncbi:MAG: phytanoyl-CoA dioxygenase family protein [Pseudomonadota bacterium]
MATREAHYLERYVDTLPPDAVSPELAPIIETLGLAENCRQLAMEGWTVIEEADSAQFTTRLRESIFDVTKTKPGGGGGSNMLLSKDRVFVEAVLNPKLMALAEFSVGRGFLLSQVAVSIRSQGAEEIGLHADQNWLPAPFPAHNMLLTACWACDDYSQAGGSTLIIPGSANLKRHPNHEEIAAKAGAIPIECPAGSVVVWDGSLWHSNYPRVLPGERVVLHVTYSRLMMRTVENYAAHAQALIRDYGPVMAQLLGQNDLLDSPTGARYDKLVKTFNDAKR